MIVIDLGKLGRAMLHRPTWLELVALLVVLGFLGFVWFSR